MTDAASWYSGRARTCGIVDHLHAALEPPPVVRHEDGGDGVVAGAHVGRRGDGEAHLAHLARRGEAHRAGAGSARHSAGTRSRTVPLMPPTCSAASRTV